MMLCWDWPRERAANSLYLQPGHMVSTLTPNRPAGVLAQDVVVVVIQKYNGCCCFHEIYPLLAMGEQQLIARSAAFIMPS